MVTTPIPEPDVVLRTLQRNRRLLHNLVGGQWRLPPRKPLTLINPVNGKPMLGYPDTRVDDLGPFIDGLKSCPKFGLHNPFLNVHRYVDLGEISHRAAVLLDYPPIANYFARLIQSVMPKSLPQCMAEVTVTRQFLKTMSGDMVRFLGGGITVPGDRTGQQSQNYPWPFGPVGIVGPFNFPLEILALQIMGALYMGNRPLVKSATTVSVVIEQFIRLLHFCGLPTTDLDLIHCNGQVMFELFKRAKHILRMVQFTGSSTVAEQLAQLLHGKIKIEDAGFDPKIIGPDFRPEWLEYVAAQCDQDAYAASGQKCSAQSILFVHRKWWLEGLRSWLERRASQRKLSDLTVGPVLSLTTDQMLDHVRKLLEITGSQLLFGGKALQNHRIPRQYGAIEPTAVMVPLKALRNNRWRKLVLTEIFGPLQVIVVYDDGDLPAVLQTCEQMTNHLTMGVVSNDQIFVDHVLAHTNNGTTYHGYEAPTSGAPSNHRFGPAADPRAAAIGGTLDDIRDTWSTVRCIIVKHGAVVVPKAPVLS